ncbi:MAG: Rpn family recombination-promoting nuclease/putative transposase [Nostocaceae cyanobacterium]|nr:Rpn family recombination-promoting nuclease/putative transposase [Nostocaceae cyanobacterium]
MKTDTIFYSLFQAFPSIFFELINRSPEEAVSYEFTSREVKQLAFRLDGLFLPKTNEPDKPFYLVEVQFQPDAGLYYRLFGELFLYLSQYKPPHPWRVVVIYPNRSIEREQTLQFGELLALNRVRRIYLDELGEAAENSLGVGVVKLVVEPEDTAGQLARRLIEQAKQQLSDEALQRDFINLIEIIIVYKLPQKSREEIAAMLGLSELKKTKFYQEVQLETKLEAISELLRLGLTLEQIAGALKLPLELVRQTAQQTINQPASLSEQEVSTQVLDSPPEVASRTAQQTRYSPQSFDEQNLGVFNHLLNTQPSLFSLENRNELAQLIASLPDESNQLSIAISKWYRKHPEILKAQLAMLKELFGDILTQDKAPGSKEGKVTTPIHPATQQTLLNSIQQSSSSGGSQSSKSGS